LRRLLDEIAETHALNAAANNIFSGCFCGLQREDLRGQTVIFRNCTGP
jgi:hypothetical protein